MPKRALLIAAVALMCGALAHADDWDKKFQSAHPQIRFETNDASVRVTSCECKEVSAHVTTNGYRVGPNDVKITEQQSGDNISLEVHVPSMHFSFGWRHSVDVTLNVPRTSDLNLHTGDGHIDVTSVTGDIRLESGDGHITANGLDGKLRVHTGDGRIDVGGRFDALDLESGDGHIEADVRAGSKNANGWRLHTGDGSITLRLPSDFSADLEAHTGDGHINVEFPVTTSGQFRSTELHGKINQGGGVLSVTSGDGNISLQRGGSSL